MNNSVPQISEAEIEVMKVLWEKDASTAKEIIAEIEKTNDWKPKTIQTLLSRLVAKGAVRTEKKDAKSFIYSAAVKKEDYQSYANRSFIKKLYDGSLNLMLASFIKDAQLSKADIEELKNILEEKQNES
ncbi:MAG: BlaI/MecI/CopY family transcriptional regulator [Clostridia bacterium]|nr:BlaI/MecI/CopY family transcriptional regulator [Clostridia bacterium]MBR2883546.1 BlaI/MecI/CopY family transcriptional regulator [Clostridia bacterium]